uniref:Exostosin-2 n=1 Tax=Cacopsylla melanoneura TaxID=428564 RepID=A0A8D8PUC0_9HEMI
MKKQTNFKSFFFGLLLIFLSAVCLVLLLQSPQQSQQISHKYLSLDSLNNVEYVTVNKSVKLNKRNEKCTYFDCFNVYRCNHGGLSNLLVYIYPLKHYIDDKNIPVGSFISKEYFDMLMTIQKSKYFTSNPEEACIFIPSIDILNQNRFRVEETSYALSSLPYWREGENHVLFNMVSGASPDYSTVVELYSGKAMIAGAGFNSWTYRHGFDISLPVYSSLSKLVHDNTPQSKQWLILSSQTNIHPEYMNELKQLTHTHPELIVMNMCENDRNSSLRCHMGQVYKYPQVLVQSTFCIVMRGSRLGQKVLHESMAAGCIPIIIADTYVLPFSEILDWKRAAIVIPEAEISSLVEVVKDLSEKHVTELRAQVNYLYWRYFSSVSAMTNTVLDILNQRVFPHLAQPYEHWNIDRQAGVIQYNPLFLQMTSRRWQGFTAVVLTYDRLPSLFLLMEKLSQVPSVSKILVIWNNQNKYPPPASKWPKISKNWTIIKTNENKLSKRFYPYAEIETEAVLSIDDDITMLTADELEFGFEVWCEFPDRIVGFPSRTHGWDNLTQSFTYESEWKNEISMVLTGAAFYHKYWNYMYTTHMPARIRNYVDSHMNCEDIAMNFLVANVTAKAPIKVTPRKKFKCPQCKNPEMLSSDTRHMMERSKCVNLFASIYGGGVGGGTLRSVEFRADPVLFRDPFPRKLKRFNDIGAI